MTRKGDWIQTYLGGQFWPLDPQPAEVQLADIAHALSNMCRFTGHVRQFYSVAEHCVHVSNMCAMTDALWGLLHDASEAYLVDLARPVKRLPEMAGYRETERLVMAAVCDRFGLDRKEPPSVTVADGRVLSNEAAILMSPLHPEWSWKPEAYPDLVIQCWSPIVAEQKFLQRFAELQAERAA